MNEKYSNKRMMARGTSGKFRKSTMSDVGITGVCKSCNHLLVSWYDGDQNDQHPDPRLFRSRCFTCEPMTSVELASQKPEPVFSMSNFFKVAQ